MADRIRVRHPHSPRPRSRLAALLAVAALAVAPEAAIAVAPAGAAAPAVVWTFVDNFNGAANARPNPATWGFDLGGGGWGNGELQTYTNSPNNVGLDGQGHLVITARKTSGGYTSARVDSHGRSSMMYGTLQARVAFTRGTGLLPAFWMLGSDLPTVGYPASGEIDIVEAPDTSHTFYTVHGPTTTGGAWSSGSYTTGLTGGYHVYTLVRTSTKIIVRVDGATTGELDKSDLRPGQQWVFTKPFDILFDVAVGGTFAGSPNANTPFPAQLKVDYVRYHP